MRRLDIAPKFSRALNLDELVKSPGTALAVIPVEAGIQSFQTVTKALGSGFHRSDNFLRSRQS